MKFVFACPRNGQVFETAEFCIAENRGVVTGADGSRKLDAKVRLTSPCPLCGDHHEYEAAELSCPFGKESDS